MNIERLISPDLTKTRKFTFSGLGCNEVLFATRVALNIRLHMNNHIMQNNFF